MYGNVRYRPGASGGGVASEGVLYGRGKLSTQHTVHSIIIYRCNCLIVLSIDAQARTRAPKPTSLYQQKAQRWDPLNMRCERGRVACLLLCFAHGCDTITVFGPRQSHRCAGTLADS